MNAALLIRSETTRFLAVGEHVVDIDTLRLLTREGEPRLTPKAAAVLLQLVHSAGRTLSRDELLNEVWKGTCPTPDVLTQAVKDLRRALGDDLHAPRFVETLPRLGYRLVAPARFLDHFPAPGRLGPASGDSHRALTTVSKRPRTAFHVVVVATVLVIGVATAIMLRRLDGAANAFTPR